jgi:hypothetical protein
MAMVSCGELFWPNDSPANRWVNGPSGAATYLFDSTNTKVASLFTLPKSGTITTVVFDLQAMTTDQQVRASVQTVDGAANPSSPTGSYYGSSNYGDDAITLSANAPLEIALGTSATATVGETVAVVLEWVSTAGNTRIAVANAGTYGGVGYYRRWSGASWTASNVQASMCVKYNDGSYAGPSFCTNATTLTYHANTAGADEYGNLLTVPFKCRVVGLWWISPSSGTTSNDMKVVLYTGTTELASSSADPQVSYRGASMVQTAYFSTAQTLSPGTYYATVQPQSTANNYTFNEIDVGSNALLGTWPGGTGCYQCKRVDAGSWSTVTNKIMPIGLIIDQLDDAAGGAGGLLRHPGMSGGAMG